MTVPRIEADQLHVLRELGAGRQGRVYAVAVGRPDAEPVAYKEYPPNLLPAVDGATLAGLAEFFHGLDGVTRSWLGERTAWPTALVTRAGAICGFLMRLAPPECYANLRQPAGYTSQLFSLEYLLNPAEYLAVLDVAVSDRDRLLLLRDLVATLARLHSLGVVAGDLSARGVVVGLHPQPRCFLLDCDAVVLRGMSVLPPAEAPGWEVPPGEPVGTVHSDAYKLGLLATRLLVGDQSTRDVSLLPAAFPEIAGLVLRCLTVTGTPDSRPAPVEWVAALDRAVPFASAAPPMYGPPPGLPPAPAVGPSPAAPRRTRRAWVWIPVLAAVVVLAVVAGIAGVLRLSRTGGTIAGPTAGPTATVTPVVPTAVTASPTPSPSPSPSPSPTVAGIVDYGAVAADPRAADVARMFDTYFSNINGHNYDAALAVYDPAGAVNPGDPAQRNAFAHDVSTSQDSDIRLAALGTGTAPAALTAQVTFRSNQAAGYGPASNPNETCTIWTLTYSLTQPAPGTYRILRGSGQHQTC